MKTIYRYQLPVTDSSVLALPKGAEVLSVGPPRDGTNDHIDLWALVPDSGAYTTPRQFCIVGTGNPFGGETGRFIGTVALLRGSFIAHVFEVQS